MASGAAETADHAADVPVGFASELIALAPAATKVASSASTWTVRDRSAFDLVDQYGDQ